MNARNAGSYEDYENDDIINGDASFRWSFGPLFAWGSKESTTILTTHPSLQVRNITCGKTSPYPTVVIVITAHHRPSTIVYFFGGSRFCLSFLDPSKKIKQAPKVVAIIAWNAHWSNITRFDIIIVWPSTLFTFKIFVILRIDSK